MYEKNSLTEPELLYNMQTAILRWYPFKDGSDILLISTGRDDDPVNEMRDGVFKWLSSLGHDIMHLSIDDLFSGESTVRNDGFDYVLLLNVLEYSIDPMKILEMIRGYLSDTGRLLITTDNRFSIRYFSGDHDMYTGRCFDSIENYDLLFEKDKELIGARSYAKFEIQDFLDGAGIHNARFFSVFPDIRYAQLVYADGYTPNEELGIRYTMYYNHPETVFLREHTLLNSLSSNGMLHQMANGYFIECAPEGQDCTDILHATLALDRGDNSTVTIIRKGSFGNVPDELKTAIDTDLIVEKISYGKSPESKYQELIDNANEIEGHGVHVIPAVARNGRYCTPYIRAMGGMEYFVSLAGKGRRELLEGIRVFFDLIEKSSDAIECDSDITFGQDEVSGKPIRCKDPGTVLRHAFVDMMPLNSFVVNGEFYFYDQEFCEYNYPAKAIMYRALIHIFSAGKVISNRISFEDALVFLGLKEDHVQWSRLDRRFIEQLRYRMVLNDFVQRHVIANEVAKNRERISFSVDEYRRLFTRCLCDINGKDIIVFGTGNFAKRFLSLFKDILPVKMLLDNDVKKQGTEIEGITIYAPEVLAGLDPNSYKLIVCIRQYVGVLKQIAPYNVQNIGFFDPDCDYEMPDKTTNQLTGNHNLQSDMQQEKKDYHIGYVAGVFDLFHIGHLNILRRAKERCDYLIVGVVLDESVTSSKGEPPVISFDERFSIVQACRYVDKAVEIPQYAGGSMDAWRLYHFDAQFSGSDYEDDAGWLANKAELEKHGSTIVFLPYTRETSTTKLKMEIARRERT